ncbi:hypothetical protein ACRYCC_13975 [Actinomadura scrupuli]|uniref:hypothetical protein n=1 Tax=Actinomadura scrupuli TaxID=559629 RepID=UPI003D97B667
MAHVEPEGNVPPAWTRDLRELKEAIRRLETAVAGLEEADPSDNGPDVEASRKVLAEQLPRTSELLVTVLGYVGASLITRSGNGEPDLDSERALDMAMRSVKALSEVSRHLPDLLGAVEGLD